MGLLGIQSTNVNSNMPIKIGGRKLTTPKVTIMETRQEASTSTEREKYEDFYNAIEASPLKGKMTHGYILKYLGFKEEDFYSKNGEHYYSKGNEKYEINENKFHLEGDPVAKTVKYINPNMSHYSTFDKNGKELGGVIKLREIDGSIKVYNYDVDVDRNRFIKSITTTKEDSDFNTNSSSASLNELRKYRALAQTQRPDGYEAVAFSRFEKTLARLFLPSTFSKSSNIPEENTQA